MSSTSTTTRKPPSSASSGIPGEDDCLRESALMSNDLLRRALTIAARNYARIIGQSTSEATALRLCWIMEASREM